jgi:UDP-2,4-diacetamido-2,4,6-trideoxy-beta-L-altropyranose hydrolase
VIQPHHVGFCVAGGGDIGGGHIVRCLALAEAFVGLGWEAGFICPSEARPLLTDSAIAEHRWTFLPSHAAADAITVGELLSCDDVVVVDRYDWHRSHEQMLRATGATIVVVDELLNREHDCDLLIDMTPGRRPGAYDALAPEGCRFLLGPTYALLRREFTRIRDQTLINRADRRGCIHRVLISTGASDPCNLTRIALDALGAIAGPLEVDLVIGGAVGDDRGTEASVLAIRSKGRHHVTAHRNPPSMADLMSKADLSIGAAGMTSWERCCLALPSIVVPVVDNQQANAGALAEAGAAIALLRTDPQLDQRLAERTMELIESPAAVIAMSEHAALLCDGEGARRVAEWIVEERGK